MLSNRCSRFEIGQSFVCRSTGNNLSSHPTLANSREYLGKMFALNLDHHRGSATYRILGNFRLKLLIAQAYLLFDNCEFSFSPAGGKLYGQCSGEPRGHTSTLAQFSLS